MPSLPLEPRLKDYNGAKRKTAEFNAMAQRVVDHINALIANNPAETQSYVYGKIALELGLTRDQVTSAVADGGHNGITVHVSDEGRRAVAGYKRPSYHDSLK